MPQGLTPQIYPRKQPQQARSAELVAAILTAAAQVLEKEGASLFTTARIAERAGVSIGSLYQYFPNKAAILFQLQRDEWRKTANILRGLIEDAQRPPMERLRSLVRAFIRSECQEAGMRMALNDAFPLYRHTPEALDGRASVRQAVRAFMREALITLPGQAALLAGDLIMNTLCSAGKRFSESLPTEAEIDRYSDAMAEMFCAYLRELWPSRGGPL
jgi:AcrR family transcriptional regulator